MFILLSGLKPENDALPGKIIYIHTITIYYICDKL